MKPTAVTPSLRQYLFAKNFQAFREVGAKECQMDPACFFSALNLSWEAMLIITKMELGRLTDIDIILFSEDAN